MLIEQTAGWQDYALLDSGDGVRLEKYGQFTLVRPDPQIIWSKRNPDIWQKADAIFSKTSADKGVWEKQNPRLPEKWLMAYKNLAFWVKLTPFKHTGVFPQQASQWDWIAQQVFEAKREINVLNLFGYTGIASLAAAVAGAKVTHLDASRPAIAWARENQQASKLLDKPIRWILDDALKFTGREIKRGVKYDAVIADPPIYGHGPAGERWDFNKNFPQLLANCRQILSTHPLFILINAYAISSSALMLENVLADHTKGLGGKIEVGELALQEKDGGRLLSTGIFGRWVT